MGPTYKKHLNDDYYPDGGETIEFLLNSEAVHKVLKGNPTQLGLFRKTLESIGIPAPDTTNEKEILKNILVTLKQRTKRNESHVILSSLKSAVQEMVKYNIKGTYIAVLLDPAGFILSNILT